MKKIKIKLFARNLFDISCLHRHPRVMGKQHVLSGMTFWLKERYKIQYPVVDSFYPGVVPPPEERK